MWKKIFKIFVILYIPILLLSLYFFYTYKQQQLDDLIVAQEKGITVKKEFFQELCYELVNDISYWSDIAYPQNFRPYEKDSVFTKPYLTLINGITDYDQLRFIDLDGKEIYRVEYRTPHEPTLAEPQDKSQRDYVKAGLTLKRNEVYLSNISLNIENGKLEKPYKPVLRAIAPIYDKSNNHLGIVVINYKMKKMLDNIKYQIIKNEISLIDDTNTIITSTLFTENLPKQIPNYEFNINKENQYDDLNLEKDTTILANGNIWSIKNIQLNDARLKKKYLGDASKTILTANNWKILVQNPKKNIDKSLSKFLEGIILFNLIAIATLLAIAIIFYRKREQKDKFYVELESKNKLLIENKNKLQYNNTKIKEINKRLEVRNKHLAEFNYLVSHNLRAPVTSMSVIVNMIKNEKDQEKVNFLLPKLEQVSNSITILTHDINKYVSILDESEVHLELVDIQILLNEVKNEFSEILLDNTDFELIEVFEDWKELKFSKFYMKSILQNLLSNAIKYRREDVKSFVKFETIFENKQKILFVTDNGTGIDLKKHGENMFKLYKRFHRNISGKGMGLFLIKSQLEVHNANITVESIAGVGTKFIIKF